MWRIQQSFFKMKTFLNSLYITTEGSYLHKERETLVIDIEGKKAHQLPLHAIEHIICFGHIMVSPALMGMCGERGVGLSFFTEYGKFQARLQGRERGNVLLRRSQYRAADKSPHILARLVIASKIMNARQTLLRHQRNHGQSEGIAQVIGSLSISLRRLEHTENLEKIRGLEGEAAACYFSVFDQLIIVEGFEFKGRVKYPPRDPVNAMLSFAYTLLTYEVASSLQGVGLDPYVGCLHRDRPGRVSLALDILEEMRSWWCDRFVLTLMNRKQMQLDDFVLEGSGAVRMRDKAKKRFLTEWQKRKQKVITHGYLGKKIPIGLIPHIQARLLARYFREDIEIYPPFTAK